MAELLERAWTLWQRVQSNDVLFWSLVGGLVVVILILLIILKQNGKRRRAQTQAVEEAATTEVVPNVFVPIDSEKDTAEIFLPLSAKLEAEATLQVKVSPEMLLKIRDAKPQCLEEILLVWPKLRAPYQEDLRQIIKSEQMLLLYARTLGQNDYQPYTLAAAWRECPDPALLPEFVELLASREEAVQMAAVRLLIELNEPQVLTYLASAILQPQRYVPARVADVLIAIGEPAAWLLVYLLGEIPSESKPLVLAVLGKMRVDYPLEQVVACLRDPLEQTRRAAAAALGDICAHPAVAALCATALDSQWSVRAACAKALGQIGDPQAIPVLQQLAQDQSWMVAANARESLRHLESRLKTG